jgi:hypothetical protein
MDLFGRKAKQLEKELEEARIALKECGEKLSKRQEDINKTNAYWKNKMRELRSQNLSNSKKKS